MNCACNRYKTCTECRNAYKEMVKRERRLTDALKEFERCSNMFGGSYKEAYLYFKENLKKEANNG